MAETRVLTPPRILASVALGAAIGGFSWWRLGAGTVGAAIVGVAVFGAALALFTRRARRRREVTAAPFPTAWRETLEKWVEYYRELDEPARARFEREAQIFIDEQTITGPRGAELEDELRVLVAASAVVVVFGREGFRYPQLRDIVVYDRAFNEDYEEEAGANILGMVHAQGPILFSAQSLRQGFRGEHDGHNVGYHEFAHVLDFEHGRADGVPGFMPWAAVRPWLKVMHDETAQIEKRRSILRRYATTNEAEFFAVATEAFFEKPRRMEKEHPELYALLVEAYGQDPAALARAAKDR